MSEQWGTEERTPAKERWRRTLVYFGLAEDTRSTGRTSAQPDAPDEIAVELAALRDELARNTRAIEDLARRLDG